MGNLATTTNLINTQPLGYLHGYQAHRPSLTFLDPAPAPEEVSCREEAVTQYKVECSTVYSQQCPPAYSAPRLPNCVTEYVSDCGSLATAPQQHCHQTYEDQCDTVYETQSKCEPSYKQICTGSYERKFSNDCSTIYEELCTVIVATKFVKDCKTKIHSVCENHNGIWKNCVDQPKEECQQLKSIQPVCTQTPITRCEEPQQACEQVPEVKCTKIPFTTRQEVCS